MQLELESVCVSFCGDRMRTADAGVFAELPVPRLMEMEAWTPPSGAEGGAEGGA